MIKVKRFEIPDFETWGNEDYRWVGKIDRFYAAIGVFAYGNKENAYHAAVSTYSNPINIYADKINAWSATFAHDDDAGLKEWYEKVSLEINKVFSEHIIKTYLEVEVEDEKQ